MNPYTSAKSGDRDCLSDNLVPVWRQKDNILLHEYDNLVGKNLQNFRNVFKYKGE